VHDRQDSRVG
jgi:hypothetical protein